MPWVSSQVAKLIEQGARLVKAAGPERFDILPLLVVTDGARCRAAPGSFGLSSRSRSISALDGGAAVWQGPKAVAFGAGVIVR
jgi:hypothetical protein